MTMLKQTVLNAKEKKKIRGILSDQWGIVDTREFEMLQNEKGRIYIANRSIENVDWNKLRINSIGSYFGEMLDGKMRLSIEGSQLMGPIAKKNVIELSSQDARLWLKGYDLAQGMYQGEIGAFMLVRHQNDFLGTTKYTTTKLLNYVPKERRIKASD